MTPLHPISTRLREAREASDLSVAELCKRARIREHVIESIDNGRFNELPDVYMRSFLRSYAEQVGVSATEIERLISEHLDGTSHHSNGNERFSVGSLTGLLRSSASTKSISEQLPNPRKRILTVLTVIFSSACLFGVYFLFKGPDDSDLSREREAALRHIDSLIAPSEPAGRLMNYFGVGSQDSIRLEAVCSDTAWINITIDRKLSDIVMLSPGQQRSWAAVDGFVLSIRNAGGVVLKRNGVELPQAGKRGETVRSVRISRTEYITSASPWKSQRDTTRIKSTKPNAPAPSAPRSPARPASK